MFCKREVLINYLTKKLTKNQQSMYFGVPNSWLQYIRQYELGATYSFIPMIRKTTYSLTLSPSSEVAPIYIIDSFYRQNYFISGELLPQRGLVMSRIFTPKKGIFSLRCGVQTFIHARSPLSKGWNWKYHSGLSHVLGLFYIITEIETLSPCQY